MASFFFAGHEFYVSDADLIGIKVFDNRTMELAAPIHCTILADGKEQKPDVIIQINVRAAKLAVPHIFNLLLA